MEIQELILFILFLATSFTTVLYAQEPLSGNVEDPYLGCSFVVPEGWTAYKTGAGYLMTSDSQKGFILIMQNEYTTAEALRTAAMEGIVEEESGIVLQPVSNPEFFMEYGVQVNLAGMVEWQQAKAYAIGLMTPFKVGITILTAVDPGIFSQDYVGRVQKIAREMTFAKPQTHPVAEQWKESLAGMRLTYMNTYSSGSSGGYSDKIIIDLCSGGIFNYSDQSSMSLDVSGGFAYSHGQNKGDGIWDITSAGGQPVLKLEFNDGSVRSYTISMQGDTFYLDNRRYFRTRDAGCQ